MWPKIRNKEKNEKRYQWKSKPRNGGNIFRKIFAIIPTKREPAKERRAGTGVKGSDSDCAGKIQITFK